VKKTKEWLFRNFSARCSEESIAEEINALSSDGWEVEKFYQLLDRVEINLFSGGPGLTDGDHLGLSYSISILLSR
jgi:hypothetical protein